jgi:NADH:ubiquinone oxidoreductase subunit 6 (subunit J)
MPLLLFSAAAPPGPGPALWPIVLPAAVGGAAVYLLLPRPRSYPVLWGVLLGVLALVLTGALLTRAGRLNPETFLFYAFSAVAVVAGTLLVTQRNPARAALSFALVVLSTCGLFLLLAAPFLMAATIIVYAGAIVVTFLFVLMLAQWAGLSDADARSREPLLSTATGFVLLATLLYVLHLSYGTQDIDRLLAHTRQAAAHDGAKEIADAVGEGSDGEPPRLFAEYESYFQARGWHDLGEQVRGLRVNQWTFAGDDPGRMKTILANLARLGEDARNRLGVPQPLAGNIPMSDLSGPPPTVPPQELRRTEEGLPQLPARNSGYLGKSLFTDYLLPVELGGTLLLVAAVGAIAIAHRRAAAGRTS